MDAVARICFVLGLLVLSFGYGYAARSWKLPPYHQLRPLADSVVAATRYFTEADYLTFDSPHPEGGVVAADGAAAAPGLTFIPHYDGEQFVADLIDLEGRVVHQWRTSFSEVFGEQPDSRPVRGRRLHPRLARHASLPGRQPAAELRGPTVPVRRRAGEARQGFAGGVEARAQHASCGDRGRGRHDLGAVPELPGPGHGRAAGLRALVL